MFPRPSRLRRWLALCLLASLPAGARPLALDDDAGRSVSLAGPARRAVSLSPHATELIYAAGAGGHLAGVTRGSDYPPAAKTLPSAGDALRPDPETLLSLRPDLLIAWQPGNDAWNRLSSQWGIPVFYSDPRRLDDIPEAIERFGKLFDTRASADAEAARLRAQLAQLRQRYSGLPVLRVFMQTGSQPLYTINNDSILADALRLCGAVSVFGDVPLLAPSVSLESVLAAAPQAVIAGVADEAETRRLQADWQASGLPAARAGHVYGLPADALYRPGPRLIDATAALCEAIDQVRHASR